MPSGITMWIILGGLILIVVVFLVVTSILDRKKRKKVVAQKKELDFRVWNSGANISKQIIKVVQNNEKELKDFVPSVGNKKMSDINNKAKKKLVEIRASEDFRLLKHNKDENKLFSENLDILIREKSNNWAKRNLKNIDFFRNYKKNESEQNVNVKNKDKKNMRKGKK